MNTKRLALARLTLVLLLATYCAACAKSETKDATEVIVVVDTDDEQLQKAMASIEVEVQDETTLAQSSMHKFELSSDTTWPLSFGVYQPPGGDDFFRLVTRGLDANGDRLVEHTDIVQFEGGKTTQHNVTLSSRCAGNFCSGHEDLTCNPDTGQCEAVMRPSGAPTGTIEVGAEAGTTQGVDAGQDAETGSTQPDAEIGGPGDSSVPDASVPDATMTDAVAPSLAGITTFGGRRTDGTITVYDDGFEQGARICTADGQFCVTGGFAP